MLESEARNTSVKNAIPVIRYSSNLFFPLSLANASLREFVYDFLVRVEMALLANIPASGFLRHLVLRQRPHGSVGLGMVSFGKEVNLLSINSFLYSLNMILTHLSLHAAYMRVLSINISN